MRIHHIFIVLLASTASFAQTAAKPHEPKKNGAIDCSKTPNIHIGNGKLKLTFTGVCQSVSIGGGKNEIIADTIVNLEVAGATNRVLVSRVDSIKLVGNKNEITWTGTADPARTEPALTFVGKENVVKKGDKAVFDGKAPAQKVDTSSVNADAKKAEDDAKKAVDDATKSLGIKLN